MIAEPGIIAPLTAGAYEAFLALPENADRAFELIDGHPVEKAMPTERHSRCLLQILLALATYEKQHGGRVNTETRYRPADDLTNDRIPDASWVSDARKQAIVESGPVVGLPDLCVEIKSPTDGYDQMRVKAAYYLAHGVRLVWLIYPEKQIVEVSSAATGTDLLTAGDTLTGGDVLPGFALAVSAIFAD